MTETQQNVFVTKEMTIGEVVDKFPYSADVMLSYGLHCIGCHVNPYESIEMGARGHGMPDDAIGKMLAEVNFVISQKMGNGNAQAAEHVHEEANEPLKLSELAASKLRELLKSKGKEGYGVRIGVTAGGCAGFTYLMDFERIMVPGDIMIDSHGVKLFVDSQSMPHLKGVVIDYVESVQQSGFKFVNPTAKASCGCGKSFH